MTRMLILTNSVLVRQRFRKSLTLPTHGIWTQTWSLPWTLSAVLRATRLWTFFLVVSAAESLSAGSFCRSLTFFFWTSLPTTLTQKLLHGLSGTSKIILAQSSQSPTTATSSTMSQAGFWKWIAAKAILSKETILNGLKQKKNALPLKKNRLQPAAAKCRKSWNGFMRAQKAVRQSTRSISPSMRPCLPKKASEFSLKTHRFQFRQVLAWEAL